jgi:hypothetical protein
MCVCVDSIYYGVCVWERERDLAEVSEVSDGAGVRSMMLLGGPHPPVDGGVKGRAVHLGQDL